MVRRSSIFDYVLSKEEAPQTGVHLSLTTVEMCFCLEEEQIDINGVFCLFANLSDKNMDVQVFKLYTATLFFCPLIFRKSCIYGFRVS